MDLAWISVIALVITVAISCTTRINPGVLAITLSWVIASGIAPWLGEPISLKVVVSGFPADLFLTLCGVTLLFSMAQVNGTLNQVAALAVRSCRGHAGLVPLAFFCLASGLSAVGAGSIAAAALIAPMAMSAAANARIPAFLMIILVGHGAIAGGMSPFALTGVIVNGLMARMGLPGQEWRMCWHIFAANTLVALTGYLIFGGWRLFRRAGLAETSRPQVADSPEPANGAGPCAIGLKSQHVITLAVIAALVAAVMAWQVPVGMAAFAAAALLLLVRAADEREAFRRVPWPVILMVCGVTVLTSLIERTGGMERLTDLITGLSTRRSLPGLLAFVTGAVSVYSSTSGVVLPTFLPAIPSLLAKVGGGDALALASSINIGGNLVDVSPLSTIGALCIASASDVEDKRLLFHKLLAWGLSMSLVAAVVCTVFFAR